MKKRNAIMLSACILVFALTGLAFAVEWYEAFTLSTTPVTTIAGVVLAALAVMWVIRKSIKTTNKSAFILPLLGALAAADYASAAGEWYDITISTTPVTTIAGVVLGALAIMWVIRKSIKTTNRS